MERRPLGLIFCSSHCIHRMPDYHHKIFYGRFSAPGTLKNMAAGALLNLGQAEGLRLGKEMLYLKDLCISEGRTGHVMAEISAMIGLKGR